MSYRIVPRNLRPDLWPLRLFGGPSWTVLVAVRAEHGHQDTDTRLQSLLASFRGQAVDPLVGLGAGHVLERLAETILQALDAVLAPPLDGQRLQEVDLALARLPRAAPLRSGWSLRLPVRGVLLGGRALRSVLLPPADGSRPASRGRALGGRRGVVAIGELFEGGRADVHGIAQGTGFRPGLGHPDQVRCDVAPDVLGACVPDARKTLAILHLRRSLHYGDVPVRLIGDLDQVRVYPLQSQAMGLVEKARVEDVLLSLAGDHELFSHRPRLTSASRSPRLPGRSNRTSR